MYQFQVYNKSTRHYEVVSTGGINRVTLDMTLGHLHEGARRRIVRTADNKIVAKR